MSFIALEVHLPETVLFHLILVYAGFRQILVKVLIHKLRIGIRCLNEFSLLWYTNRIPMDLSARFCTTCRRFDLLLRMKAHAGGA